MEYVPQNLSRSGYDPSELLRRLETYGFQFHAVSEGQGRILPVSDEKAILEAQAADPLTVNLYLERLRSKQEEERGRERFSNRLGTTPQFVEELAVPPDSKSQPLDCRWRYVELPRDLAVSGTRHEPAEDGREQVSSLQPVGRGECL